MLYYCITYLAQQDLADSTIRVYLSALRHHHIAHNISEADHTKMPKLKPVNSGITGPLEAICGWSGPA